jgi:hypothetical protein
LLTSEKIVDIPTAYVSFGDRKVGVYDKIFGGRNFIGISFRFGCESL